jgi:hypothetical protein
VGDRITFQANFGTGWSGAGEIITLKAFDDKDSLENQGWFLDPGTLNQNGVVRFIASPLKPGSLTLPALMLIGKDGHPIARSAPLTLNIIGPTVGPEEKPELLDVISFTLPIRYWIYIGLILVGLFGALRYLYLRFLKNRAPPKPLSIPIIPVEPDHIAALKKLDDLFVRYPFSPDHLKIVSFGISEITKEFFSKRFKIEAREATTDEMIMLLRREALSGDQLKAIQILFNELDQYKFTKVQDYPLIYEETQSNLKIKASLIIQKWALGSIEEEHST